MKAQGKTHGRALRQVVDRLLGVACAMLRDRTLFDPGTHRPPRAGWRGRPWFFWSTNCLRARDSSRNLTMASFGGLPAAQALRVGAKAVSIQHAHMVGLRAPVHADEPRLRHLVLPFGCGSLPLSACRVACPYLYWCSRALTLHWASNAAKQPGHKSQQGARGTVRRWSLLAACRPSFSDSCRC